MGGNPLLLGFLAFGLLLMVALGVLAVLQRRQFADQVRQINEIIQEARRLKAEEAAAASDDSSDDSGPADD